MKPTQVTVSSQTTSAAVPVDWTETGFGIGLQLVISGTGTYKVQFTLDNIQDSTVTPTWFDHPILTGKTASDVGNVAYPCRAIRLNCTAWTSGSGILTILQGGRN